MKPNLLSHQRHIEEILRSGNYHLSSFSFPNIFIWSDFFDFRFETIAGYLCIFAQNEIGSFLYLPPLKKDVGARLLYNDVSEKKKFLTAVFESFKLMNATNRTPQISRIENVETGYLNSLPRERIHFFKKTYEYCYFKEDLILFKGNVFKSKRASYNHFVKHHTYEFIPFQIEMKSECAKLYEGWAKNRLGKIEDDIYNHMLLENEGVHQLAMTYYEQLGLIGRVVLVNGKIRAYSFGFPLNSSIFCILFEITDLSLSGMSVFIFREFCRDPQLEQYKFINAMDDFGMKNIADVKMSFRPTVLVPSYVISLAALKLF